MKRECTVLAEQLSAALQGDLGPAECRRLRGHAAACPRCRLVAAELRDVSGLCRKAGATPLPPSVRRKARARVRAIMTASARTKTR